MVNLESVITGKKRMSIPAWAKTKKISPDFAKMLYQSLSEPIEFIFNMGKMEKLFDKVKKDSGDEIRDALIRVQIWCSINAHHDAVKAEKQLFVSQVMEKIFFNGNVLAEEGEEREDISEE